MPVEVLTKLQVPAGPVVNVKDALMGAAQGELVTLITAIALLEQLGTAVPLCALR